jgi:hypothetical protein
MNEIEKIFGRNAQLIVLEYLIGNRGTTTYLSGNIVKEGKMGKQIRTFTLNEDSEVTKLLIRFYEDLNKILEKRV